MSNEQISLPYFLVIMVVFGLIIRYLFFGGSAPHQPARTAESYLRSREIAVERIQQMFPQAERRSILWDLQRNGGNIQHTTERILAGRLDTVRPLSSRINAILRITNSSRQPPVSFQPPPPPGQPASSTTTASRQPDKSLQPDLITRYNLKEKLSASAFEEEQNSKGWSSNREERQASLQRRREEMVLQARKKMMAKMALDKAAAERAAI